MIGAGLMAGLGAAGAGAAPAHEPQRRTGGSDDEIKDAIDDVNKALGELRAAGDPGTGAAAAVRQAQRQFLKGQHRFPEFIDVGIGVWEDVYDWHVRFQQPINISRQPDGRYALVFMQTLLVLRPEHAESYIGAPYDRQ
jgi:hypothetical protein